MPTYLYPSSIPYPIPLRSTIHCTRPTRYKKCKIVHLAWNIIISQFVPPALSGSLFQPVSRVGRKRSSSIMYCTFEGVLERLVDAKQLGSGWDVILVKVSFTWLVAIHILHCHAFPAKWHFYVTHVKKWHWNFHAEWKSTQHTKFQIISIRKMKEYLNYWWSGQQKLNLQNKESN